MKKTQASQVVALALAAVFAGSAQAADVSNGLIVRFAYGTSKKEIKSILKSDSVRVSKDLFPGASIHLVTADNPEELKGLNKSLKSVPEVLYVQPNHMLTQRRSPNDPRYAEQWNMNNTTQENSDIHAEEAWELGVGGRDRAGNEVVVAVVDGGIDYTHEDLAPNMWTNVNEVAGNNVDDDGNGYIDDVNGWNASDHNGEVGSEDHGTHVAGIIGAKGDNGKHVTGVNWNIRIMPVSVGWFSTAAVIEAYGYVLAQKKLWLKTQGRLGANVVATNSSFGYDYADCSTGEFPAWNDIYNQMGEFGILSAAATINNDTNVDVEGDVPTACSSEFIVAVTNTNRQDVKYNYAGYGAKNIDLAAPGTDILSTVPGNAARTMTGTSMASPHVAGAIGFVHSVASQSFYDYYVENPSQAALSLKAMLLNTTDALPSLQGVTVSGGRLNLEKAARAVATFDQESVKSLLDMFDLGKVLAGPAL